MSLSFSRYSGILVENLKKTSGYATMVHGGGAFRIALRQLLQNRKLRHLWRHNLGSIWKLQKVARENCSIGAFYNITKYQHSPIKTIGRDSFFLRPETPKIQVFRGQPAPRGRTAPIFLGDTTRPRLITYVQVWSKSDQRRQRKTLYKQTNKQTDRQTDTTKIMVTWPWTKNSGQRVSHLPSTCRVTHSNLGSLWYEKTGALKDTVRCWWRGIMGSAVSI